MDTFLKWFVGLLSVIISSAASGVTAGIIAPESFNFSHAGLMKLGALCGVNALLAGANYLQKSPLWFSTQTSTQTITLTQTNTAPVEPPTKQ